MAGGGGGDFVGGIGGGEGGFEGVLQCVALCCSVLQCTTMDRSVLVVGRVALKVCAVCCNVL